MPDKPNRTLLWRNALCRTTADAPGGYDKYWLVSTDGSGKKVIFEHIIPNAHESGEPLVRPIRSWTWRDFLGKPTAPRTRTAIQRELEAQNARQKNRSKTTN